MDMSVSVAPEKQTVSAATKPDHGRSPNASDLDEWLAKVDAMGELKRITAEVDPDLEAATITYLVGSQKSPALLFENIKGHPGHRALYNMIGCNLSRFCLMIGEEPMDHPLKAVQALQKKMGRTMKPKEVAPETAICNQNIVTGDNIDIRQFPGQRMWPLDGGLYLGTGDAVVTQCPETGRINVGTYRMMIKGPREIGVYTSPGKDATLDREKWWKMGKPMPIAAAYGIDPLLFLVAATSFPKTESEYEYYGGINGAPIELFKSDVTGLPLPAGAEIILEGFVYPDETFAEGPFGEFTGYYGRPSGATPYMRVEKVRFRNNPTLTCALMADGPANEAGCSGRRCGRLRSGRTCKNSACPASRACGRFPRPPAGASPWSRSSRCIRATRRRRWRSPRNASAALISANTSSSSMTISIRATCIRCCGRWRPGRGRRNRSTFCARPGARSSIRASIRRKSGRGDRRR